MRAFLPIALPLFASLIGGCSEAAGSTEIHGRSGPELLRVAEQSFSSIPFRTTRPPQSLTLLDDGGCVDGRGECTYLDANHVQHYFGGPGGELVVKAVQVSDVGNEPIAALGIGRARDLGEVVERVQHFILEAKVTCDENLAGNEITCGATLGPGWIKLFFDASRHLTEVRIDAYHFT